MLDVPRSRDAYEGVAVNSLAFAGAFFAREPRQLRARSSDEKITPDCMEILRRRVEAVEYIGSLNVRRGAPASGRV